MKSTAQRLTEYGMALTRYKKMLTAREENSKREKPTKMKELGTEPKCHEFGLTEDFWTQKTREQILGVPRMVPMRRKI